MSDLSDWTSPSAGLYDEIIKEIAEFHASVNSGP